jgi:hypothetical protein
MCAEEGSAPVKANEEFQSKKADFETKYATGKGLLA